MKKQKMRKLLERGFAVGRRLSMREGLIIRSMRSYIPSCIFRFLFPKSLTTLTPNLPFPTTSSPSQKTGLCNLNTTSTSGRITSSTSTKATSSDIRASEITHLSKQQQEVLTAVANGKSVFLTGSGGTGKTFLLQQAINVLRQTYRPSEVFVTASTGVAACALNGQTLHSFSGIGSGVGGKDLLLNKVAKNKPATNRWKFVKALVIDEISMVSGELFESLEYIARKNRAKKTKLGGSDEETWGGIQLIVSGDFFQLPPIINGYAVENSRSQIKEFAFEADCWESSFDLQVELTQVFRQSDSQLIELLQGIRRGLKDPQHLQLLSQCCSDELTFESKIGSDSSNAPPRLFPRNDDVRRINNEKLRNLGGEIVSYRAVDTGSERSKSQLKQGIAPDELEICVGARVMLIKNKDVESGLVNGATGTVTGFSEETGRVIRKICRRGGLLPKVRFDSGQEVVVKPDSWNVMEGEQKLATRKQLPLILAWAISIHKCQGMTLDSLQTDLSRAFGCGMVYVALSRVRSLGGLHLTGFNSSKIKANPKVLQFYDSGLQYYEGHLNS